MSIGDFDFEDLVGEEFDFYGVDGQRFRLDDTTYEVIEREDGCEVVVSDEPIEGMPIGRVRVTVDNVAFSEECYEITDLHDDHCWLRFGIELEGVDFYSPYGYYMPVFHFDYVPKGMESQDDD